MVVPLQIPGIEAQVNLFEEKLQNTRNGPNEKNSTAEVQKRSSKANVEQVVKSSKRSSVVTTQIMDQVADNVIAKSTPKMAQKNEIAIYPAADFVVRLKSGMGDKEP